jgi:hypothetical protein
MSREIRFIVESILQNSNASKQRLGQIIVEKNEKFIRTCSVLPELQHLDNKIKQAIG